MKKNTSSKARRRRFEKRRKSTSTRLAGSESLEPRQLLSVSPHNNWVNTVADLNGDTQQTERVAQMLTKIPEGANQALAIAANWTDLQGLDLEIKVDNNGDGVFDASEIVTTHGEAETLVDLATPTGTPGFAGEGAYSVGYACSFPGMGDCGLTDQTGLDAVHSAVYIHPIGSSAISRNVMVTLSGSLTTDILGTIGSYDNVAQGDTVGNTHAVGNSEIDLGLTYDQPGNAGANDEGDVGFNGPAPGGGVEYTALKYPGTVPSGTPGYSINVNAGNSALDAVHARFVNGTGTDALSPVGNSIQVGAGQTVLPNGVTGGNYTQSGARSSGGVSMDPDGTFDWTFTDTVDSDGARFFSHAAVEIRNVDGVVPYDFGDAPDPSYDTLLANDGPRHAVFNPAGDLVGGPYFGPNSPDAEMDGQPEALAGMMTGGDDFTDGVFDLLRFDVGEGAGPANSSTDVNAVVHHTGGITAFGFTLDGNPGLETFNIGLSDVTSVEFFSAAGSGNEAFTIDNIVTNFGTTQFEGSNAQATGTQSVVTNPIYSTGFNFASSLNETHLVNTDGPISSNGTTTLKIDDSEGDGNVVTMSLVSVDDEDGVLDYYNNNANGAGGDVPTEMFVSDFMNTSAATVALDIQGVSASEPGYVSAWIDWNADGDFADANEVITTGFAVTANGELELPVTIPASMGGGITSSGESIMRIRIHSDPCAEGAALAPTGHAHDGEVEDHKVVIKQGSSVHGTKYEDINGDGTADDIFGPGNAQGDTNGVMVEIVNDDGSSVTDLLGYSVDPVETDANGDYWFSYLPAGDYIVRERLDLTDINDDDTADNGQGLAQHDPTDMHIGNADYPIQHEITLGTDHGGDDLYTAAKIEDLDFLNYVEGSIHGVKFDDLNADGNFDFPDEIGLPGVTFELYKFIDTYNYTFNPHTSANEISFTTYKWDLVATTLSAAHGEFWFTGLEPGKYAVREVPGSWTQSTEQPTDSPASEFFGAADVNDDWEISDTELFDYIDSNDDNELTVTEINAAFNTGLGSKPSDDAATLTINSRDELQWDDDTSFTDDPYEGEAYVRPMDLNDDGLISQSEIDAAATAAALKNGSAAYDSGNTSLIFGNYLGATVTGEKWEDTDGDGDGDALYDGVTFELWKDVDNSGSLSPADTLIESKDSGHTGTTGQFQFTGIKPGFDYVVVETTPAGNIADQITHDDREFAFSATSGSTHDAGDWVNLVYGSIHGVKFHDLDADGNFDFNDGEVGLPGVTFDLYKFVGSHNYTYDPASTAGTVSYTTYEWEHITSTDSAAHGEFWFTGLLPGQYVVREAEIGGNWNQRTAQPSHDPNSEFDGTIDGADGSTPNGSITLAEIEAAFNVAPGDNPGLRPTGVITITSGYEAQWDDNTTFTSDPYKGEAYNRPMDSNGNGLIDQSEIDEAIANNSLKTGSDPYAPSHFGFTPAGSDERTAWNSLVFGNYETITITGEKLEVDTADGDVAFAGIEFELYRDWGSVGVFEPGTDSLVDTATTIDGTFEFTDVQPGRDYIVVEKADQEIDPGADNQLSHDDSVYAFTAVSGQDVVIEDAWENFVYGSIHGVKFHDLDADGTYDFGDGERGIEDITFELYKFVGTNTYTYDVFSYDDAPDFRTYEWDFVKRTTSMDHGEFWFNNLEPGTYTVREVAGADWVSSTGQPMGDPNNTFHGVGVGPHTAASITNAFDTDLGDKPGDWALTIYSRDELQWDDDTTFTDDPYEGEAYDRAMDTNGDGIITDADIQADTSLKIGSLAIPGLSFGNYEEVTVSGHKVETNTAVGDVDFEGIEFELYKSDGTLVDTVETDSDGEFEFTDVMPGMDYYVVEKADQEIDPGADNQLTHDDRQYDFTAVSGEDYDAGTWENYVLGSIHGVKFHDLDADGTYDFDEGERGIENITFDLYKFVGTNTYTYDVFSYDDVPVFKTYEWTQVASTVSMDHGEFWFNDLEPGVYAVREDISGTDWFSSTGQPMGDPDNTFSGVGAGPLTAASIMSAFDTDLGDDPDATGTAALTIYSRDELQWDDNTTFTDDPYEGEAYNRAMDTNGDGIITDADVQADTSLKNGSLAIPELSFGNYETITVSGKKLEVDTADGDVAFEGIEFELYKKSDGSLVATDTTNSDGEFEFTGIMPGMDYYVVEKLDQEIDPGMDNQLTHDTSEFDFTAVSGQDVVIEDAWENFVYGSIHGVKFHDINADGTYDFDEGERGIENITFDLYKFVGTNTYTYDVFSYDDVPVFKTYEWDFVTRATSMDHGEFWFNNLEPGVYAVREDISGTDWVSSTGQPMGDPDNTFSGVGPGPHTAASINAAFDTDLGEKPGDWALTIYSRDELQWDDNTTFTSDPYEGEAYNRAMDTNSDGIITDADVQADTSLKNGSDAIPGLSFGNYEVGSITGIKGEDRDNDGTRDVVFPGVEFVLYKDVNEDGALDAGDVAIGDPLATDGSGQFTFADLKPGFYLVAEPDAQSIDPHGNQLSHDPKVFAVEIESGDDVNAGEWLNYVYGSIHGFKFLDVDEDGLWDIGSDYNGEAGADDDGKVEPVLEGVVFDLYKFIGTETYSYNPFSGNAVTFTTYEWEKVATEETDVHGEFWFLDLQPGITYSVREDLSGTYFEQTTGQAQGDPTSVFDPSSVDANNDGVITQAEIASASSVYLGDNPDDANSSTYTITSRDEFQWDDETTFEDVEDYDMAAYNRPMDLNGDGLISADEEKYAIDSTSLKTGQPADSSLMFGNKYDAGTIHGFKFDDIDGDGVWDHFPGTDYIPGNGEPGIGGILIGLEDASGNLVNLADGSPALTTTMANGEFWFENVIPDQPLTIVEYLNDLRSDSNLNGIPDGHEGMYRTTAVEEVTVSGGEELVWNAGGSVNTALIIGNAVTGSIHGFKYEDFNLNGIYEPDAHWPDVPMEWAVFQLLDSNGDIVDINGDNVGDDNDIQMTNADGEFWFTNLEIGDYTLIERMDLTDRNDLFGPGSNGNPGPPDGLPDGNGITDDQEGLGASTPTTWSVSIGSGEEYVWADGAANIDQVTAVDPDDVTAGTDISTYFDFVDMQEEFADTAASSSVLGPVLAIAPVSFSSASTGNLVYGHNPGAGSPYAADEFIFPSVAGGQSHVFGAEFDVAVMSVSIDIIGNSAGDVGLIAAYDAAGNLLDTQRSAVVGANEVTTLTFTAPTGTVIGSIEAGGDFAIASTVGLDNLTYETFPLKSEVLVGSELMFGNYYAGAVHGVKTHAGSDIGVPNIELTLSNADHTYTTTTGPDGQYVFADVVPGAYTLEETPSSAVIGGFDPFAVVVEYGTVHVSELGISSPYEGLQTESLLTSLAIENEISSSIHGIKVHGDSDVPIEGISFELRTTGGTLVLTDTTDAGGEFDFQGINPGTYQIVELDSGQPTDSFASFIITVASGEVHVWQSGEAGTLPAGQTEVANSQLVVENTLEGSIHGEVKDALGVGLSGVLVSLTNGAGNDMLTTTASGANGSFSFDDLAPGTYLVTVLGSGFINSQTTVVVDSGEEETSSALPSGTLELGQYETINTALCFQMGAANAAPVVTEVKVGSSFWTSAGSTNNFTGYVDPTDGLGYEIPTGYATVPSSFAPTSQNSVLPWRNIDKLYVEFNEAVQPPTGGWSSPGVVAIFNSSNAAVPVSNISYDATNFRLTITTADALGDDRYLLAIDDTVTDAGGAALDGEFANGTDTLFNNLGTSGDGVAGTKFEFTFAVQHADASGSGTVDVTDLSRLGTGFGGTTGNVAATANYNPYADFNGSGTIDVTDLSILGTNFGDNSIPSTPVPTNPLFLRSNAAAVDSVFGEDDDDDDDLLDSLANDVAGEGVHTARAGRFQ